MAHTVNIRGPGHVTYSIQNLVGPVLVKAGSQNFVRKVHIRDNYKLQVGPQGHQVTCRHVVQLLGDSVVAQSLGCVSVGYAWVQAINPCLTEVSCSLQ
jgi:hypothetical protein